VFVFKVTSSMKARPGLSSEIEDSDGNQLYLAELNWSHVEKGEGESQPAKA